MRKIIFHIFLTLASVSLSWAQSDPCSSAQFQASDSGQWSIVHAYDWMSVADLYGSDGEFCLPNGCFYLYGYTGSGWISEGDIQISVENVNIPLQFQYADSTGYIIAFFDWNSSSGCGDASACNYDSTATCLDYSICNYDCLGCTNSSAVNFNPTATVDNGTCCFNEWAEISATDSIYYNITDGIGNYILSGSNYDNYSPTGFCYQPGCFNLYVQGIDNDPFQVNITTNNGTIILNETVPQGWWTSFNFSNQGSSGCTDQWACNYNPNATCNDGSCDYYSCQGCTDSTASNFNPEATYDNGTCCYGPLMSIDVPSSVWWYYYAANNYASGVGPTNTCSSPGCATFYAYNNTYEAFDYSILDQNGNVIAEGNSWDAGNEWDDISTVHMTVSNGEVISGCSDIYACNFNPDANCLDYALCDYSCQGCTNPDAFNYNSNATIDNGSCCLDNYFEVTAVSSGGMVSWSAMDGYGMMVGSTDYSQETSGFCAASSCITFYASDFMGMPFSLIIKRNGVVVYSNNNITEYNFVWNYDNNQIVGCADPNACNFNPDANCFLYNICDYSCQGCTNPIAINFNPNATIDNGTCCLQENWQTINASGNLFFYVAANDGTQSQQGYYPEVSGFCMNSNCYMMYAFATDGMQQEISISNDTLNNYYSFSTNPYLGYNIENIGINEVAGCTDPSACNFNPNATCDYGYCEYYCGGCMDPQALNFSELATFDDGSCAYQVASPIIGMQMVPDADNQQFYVMIALTEMGNVSPYAVSNTMDNGMMTMMNAGTAMAGPYNCGDSVQFHVHALGYNMNTVMTSPTYRMDCESLAVSETKNLMALVYPNPSNQLLNLINIEPNTLITIRDTQGRLIHAEKAASNQKSLDCSQWSNGFYFIELKDNDQVQQLKVQVMH